MQFEIDPRFKKSSNQSRKRRIIRKLRHFGIIAGIFTGILAVGALGVFLVRSWLSTPFETAQEGDELTMVQVENSAETDIIAVRAAFIDIPKDPMILRFNQPDENKAQQLSGPNTLPIERIGPPQSDRLTLLVDDLVVQGTELVTTIPSSRADLAYFQAQRSQALAEANNNAATPTAPALDAQEGDIVSVDGKSGSWGELVTQSDQVEDTFTYIETRIENTTSIAFTLRDNARLPLYEDDIILVQIDRDLSEILTETGLSEPAAKQAASAAIRLLSLPDKVSAGSLIAIRIRPDVRGPQLMQMSLYQEETYKGTLTQIGAGRFDTGADPWAGEDLLSQSAQIRPTAPLQQNVRLLDALYSSAIRNGMSTTLVGELIVMMSQSYDLDRYAAVGDKFTILYSTEHQADVGAGQILYAQIAGPSGKLDCYVVPDTARQGFSCHKQIGSSGGLSAGLVVPVAGIKTSGFGPRMHPRLGQLRNHNGVDWAAPIGTPIHAAATGKITVLGDGRGYGNVIYIDHADGLQTRYAHLNAFAEGLSRGDQVKAGQLIGYVGTTGLSTGPHLHFELRKNGAPLDPLGGLGGATTGGAIDILVNQIIQVESGGRADAANSRSTAKGLGQFIDSTWIRMMQTYRPDLVKTMSRGDLLALRTNPELSREMVRNLARENEAYLRSRGHDITPGRLYLAHFLGMDGANRALRSDAKKTVLEVMGAEVVDSNRFLKGMTIADLWAWADRKMRRGSGQVVVSRTVSPEVKAYMSVIDTLLESLQRQVGD